MFILIIESFEREEALWSPFTSPRAAGAGYVLRLSIGATVITLMLWLIRFGLVFYRSGWHMNSNFCAMSSLERGLAGV